MPRMPTPKKAPKKSAKSAAKPSAKSSAKSSGKKPAKPAPKKAPAKAAKSAPKKTPTKAAKPAPTPHGKAGTLTSDQALARYTPLALQLAKKDVLVCRLDLALALHNLQLGVASIEPYAARLRKEVSGLPVAELLALPDLGLALIFASEQVEQPSPQAQNRQDLARLRDLREPMLLIAEALALLGLLPEKKVHNIRIGSGAMDSARDGIALCQLYQAHAADLADKHPFTAAHFAELSELGERLTRTIIPKSARAATKRERASTPDLCNRLYTLLWQRHQDLRKAGYYLFGPELDLKVPTLQARRSAAKPKKSAPAPAPAPAAP